ncbi:MAG: hypothetical protein U9N87_11290 [Planctomycetota bacterium]|nr:hypothetical protein [Planctomycetota bacterium]
METTLTASPVRRAVVFLSAALAVMVAGSWTSHCRAAVSFGNIDPRPIQTNSIVPPGHMRKEPFRTMSVPSKPSAPMPHFQQHKILPDHIQMVPIQKDDMLRSSMRQNRIEFNNISKSYILPQKINGKPLLQPISPGQKMAAPVRPAGPYFNFDPTMEGHNKPTTRFDSSIRLNMGHQAMPAPPSPMGW